MFAILSYMFGWSEFPSLISVRPPERPHMAFPATLPLHIAFHRPQLEAGRETPGGDCRGMGGSVAQKGNAASLDRRRRCAVVGNVRGGDASTRTTRFIDALLSK